MESPRLGNAKSPGGPPKAGRPARRFAPPLTVSRGTGEEQEEDDIAHELAAYLRNPPPWLENQAEAVRRNPSLLKATCSSVAYEVFGYAGRGAEIEAAVEAWLREIGGLPSAEAAAERDAFVAEVAAYEASQPEPEG